MFEKRPFFFYFFTVKSRLWRNVGARTERGRTNSRMDKKRSANYSIILEEYIYIY